MWYIHSQAKTQGPLEADNVRKMLANNKIQFVDYAWSEGLTKWTRILDIDEFIGDAPTYPRSPIPSRTKKSAAVISVEELDDGEIVAAAVIEKKITKKKTLAAKPKTAAEIAEWERNRRFPRHFIEAQVLINAEPCDVINISEGGLFVRAKEILPVGTEIEFTLVSPYFPQSLVMTGLVIRQGFAALGVTSKEVGFAIEFARINPSHRRLIRQFIDDHSSEVLAS